MIDEMEELKRYNKIYIMAPKLIKLYDKFEDFKEYQSINDKFWLDMNEFISEHGKYLIEKYAMSRFGKEWYEKNKEQFFYIEDWKFIEKDLKYRRLLTKIFIDKIIREIIHLKKINGPFLPPLYKEENIDTWFIDNYRILGFNYIKPNNRYPDYKCICKMEPSNILLEFNENIQSLKRFLSSYHDSGGYEINVELEYKSSNFIIHHHDPNNVDTIIYYEKNRDIFDSHKNNIPIIELKEFVDNRYKWPLEDKDDYEIERIRDRIHFIKDLFVEEFLFNNGKLENLDNSLKNFIIEHLDHKKGLMRKSEKIKDYIHNDFEIQELLHMLEKYNIITKNDINQLMN